MSASRCKTRTAYLALLDRDPVEVNTLVSSMLIKLTTFFRDAEVWTALDKVLKELVRKRGKTQELRIWSAGCATGEEAYSIAIAAAEALGPGYPGPELKVFGTDVDEASSSFPRRGVYPAQQLEGGSKERLQRWFVPNGPGYMVRKELRRSVVFGVNNLVSDAPVSRIDLILCRNVFIYMDSDLQKRVLARFHFSLRRSGVLVLGRSELIPFAAKLFEPVDLARRIYLKDSQHDTPARHPSGEDQLVSQLEKEGSEALMLAPPPVDPQYKLLTSIVDSYPCPAIVTSTEGIVTFLNHAASQLWGRSEAELVGKRLASLQLPGLNPDLLVAQSARVRAGRSEREVADGVMEVPGSEPVTLRAQVVPLRGNGKDMQGLLYVAHDVTPLRSLEQNLQRANSELQAANLQLQTSKERLRA